MKHLDRVSDADLVQTLLGCRNAASAYEVLDQCGGLRGIARAGVGSLAEKTSTSQARKLAAAVELGRRAIEATTTVDFRLSHQDAVTAWARPRLATLDHEELWVLALDGRHGLRAATCVASGGIHGLHVTSRDVLRAAVREAASAFVLVHNHPSGDPTPSDEDLAFTAKVVAGASTLDTPMLDHIIVARDRSCSMLAQGHLARMR